MGLGSASSSLGAEHVRDPVEAGPYAQNVQTVPARPDRMREWDLMYRRERDLGVRGGCRLGAVFGVQCRPMCRDMPLYAAICRSLERKLLIFLRFGFFFEPEGEARAVSE